MQFSGKIIHVSGTEVVGQKETPKIFIVIEETEGQYPNSLSIDFLGEKTGIVSSYSVGDIVDVKFNVSCREYNGKWYNSLRGWAISSGTGSNNNASGNAGSAKQNDDLPF